MTTKAPVLCLSRSRWADEVAAHRNRYQMLSRFARDRRVVLLECPFELATLARPSRAKVAGLADALGSARRDPTGVTTLRPLAWWLRDGDGASWRLNRWLYRPWLARARRLVGGPPVAWVYDHRLWPLLGHVPAAARVYHCTEDYPGIAGRAHGPRVGAWVAEQERELLRRVDLVLAVSEGIADRLREQHRDVRVVRSGVDLGLYRPDAPCLDDCRPVAELPRPVLGYVGEVNYRLDFGLLERVADRFPSGSLVLVGAESGLADRADFRRLAARRNVRRFGHRPPGVLPSLIAHFDVCLMPFIQEAWFVRAAQPLKTFEYLACGKPVVSTMLPNLRPWSQVVALCDTHGEFVDACASAAAGDAQGARDARLAAARANSWETRFAEVDAALTELVAPGRARATMPA